MLCEVLKLRSRAKVESSIQWANNTYIYTKCKFDTYLVNIPDIVTKWICVHPAQNIGGIRYRTIGRSQQVRLWATKEIQFFVFLHIGDWKVCTKPWLALEWSARIVERYWISQRVGGFYDVAIVNIETQRQGFKIPGRDSIFQSQETKEYKKAG